MINMRNPEPQELEKLIVAQAAKIIQLENELAKANRYGDMWKQDFMDLNKRYCNLLEKKQPEAEECF